MELKPRAFTATVRQGQRNQALKGFQTGEYRVLVATDVAARGIHVDGIAHVVNFDLPQAPEDFIHRVGRTGRAGARGTASTFGTRSERGDIRRIEQLLSLRLTRQTVPENIAKQSEPKVIVLPGSQAFVQRAESRPRRAVASFGPRRRG